MQSRCETASQRRPRRVAGAVHNAELTSGYLDWAYHRGRMRRPLPVMPRGPRRRRPTGPRRRLFACPRVAPDWELGALRALMKPQANGAILHRDARQPWPDDAADAVETARRVVR